MFRTFFKVFTLPKMVRVSKDQKLDSFTLVRGDQGRKGVQNKRNADTFKNQLY